MKIFTLYKLPAFLIVSLLLALVLPNDVQGQIWYNSSWLYRRAITIDYTKVGAGSPANFPVLIKINDAKLASGALATGNDILFTSSDGTTKINHEIESYTTATGALVAWVEIPSLSSSANTIIYMYYGNAAAASQQNITGTWDANFKGVYHLNKAFADATSNNNDGTNTGTTDITGKISQGRGFVEGGSTHIDIPGLLNSPSNITLSAWFFRNSAATANSVIVSLGDCASLLTEASANATKGSYYTGGNVWQNTYLPTNYNNAWHYAVYTYSGAGAGAIQTLYIDGAMVDTTKNTAAISYVGQGANTKIGTHANNKGGFDFYGNIDEVRVAGTARSAGWILTEFNNQNSPSTFFSISAESSYKTWNGGAGTNNWGDANNWNPAGVPASSDNVILAGANTININVVAASNNVTLNNAGLVLTVNSGYSLSILGNLTLTAGVLNTQQAFPTVAGTVNIVGGTVGFTGISAQTIPAYNYYNLTINKSAGIGNIAGNTTVTGNLTITAGTFSANNFNITVGGNWINNGVFTAGTSMVTFNGAGTNTITGTSSTAFNTITLNKGTDYISNIMDVQSPITMTAGGLTLSNGTLKISSNSAFTPFITELAIPYNIPSTAGLWVNGATASISTTSNIGCAGLIHVTYGTLNIGDAVDEKLNAANGAVILVDGGTVNIAGRLTFVNNDPIIFTISSGSFNVATIGNTSQKYDPFTIIAKGSTFNMSGGTIVIAKTASSGIGYLNNAGTSTVTGGTLQIGNAATTAADTISITSTPPLWNLTVNNTNAPVTQLTNDLVVKNDLTISGGRINANNNNLSVGRNWINNGVFIPGTDTVTFNGTVTGSVGGSAGTTFNGLTINCSSGITLATNTTVGGTLTFTNGNITTGSYSLYLNDTGSVSRTGGYVIGNFKKRIATGTTSKLFEIGDAGNYTPVTVTFTSVAKAGDLTASTLAGNHANIGSSTFNASKTVNRTWTLTNSGTIFTNYNATFNFAAGDLNTGAATSNFIVGRYNSGWTYPTAGTKNPLNTQATGITAFGDFQIGEQCLPASTSAAGPDQTGAATCGLTTITLAANTPAIGTGSWSIISGAGGMVTTPSSPASTFTGTTGTTYTLRWTISNNPCNSSTDDVIITFNQNPFISQIPSLNLIGNYRFEGNANDATGNNNGILQNSPLPSTDRFNNSNKAYILNGSSQYVATTNAYTNPTDFTTSVWFKTNTITGGKLIGFGGNQTGLSGNYDRHIYMNNAGQIYFGVYANQVITVNSTQSYNDNTWHLATATLSASAGMALYIDGTVVAINTTITSAQNFTGYWKIGYDNINGWTSSPSSAYFNGGLDDILIYSRALSASEIYTLYTSPDGAGNNGPVCTGSTIGLTATSKTGATYAWSGPNGYTSAAQNPTFPYAVTNAGLYTLNVTSAGCTVTAYTNMSSGNAGLWTGNLSTNWATDGNWCSGSAPTSTTNVTIPSVGITNMPSVGSSAICNNINVNTGATVVVTNTGILNIAGTINNSGTFTASSGTIVMNGASLQTIPASTFTGNLVQHLTINNAAGINLNGTLNIAGILLVSAGQFNTGGFLTLLSTATQTALIDGTGMGSVTGNVNMQGYLASAFGYHYISSPFQSATVSQLSNYIKLIDTTKIPPLYWYDESRTTSGWVSYTDSTGLLNPLQGYTANFGVSHSPLTFKLNGVVNSGLISASTLFNHNNDYTLGFNLVGNPYPSPIDLSITSGLTRTNIDNAFYFFNASSTDQYSGIYSSYVNGVSTGTISTIIPAMQGFFVHVSNGTFPVSGSLTFNNNARIRQLIPPIRALNGIDDRPLLRLCIQSINDATLSDPMVVYFDDSAIPAYNKELDALKLINTDFKIPNLYAVSTDGTNLSISAIPNPGNSIKKVPLGLETNTSGWFQFNASTIKNIPVGMPIYLSDAQTGINQDLQLNPLYRLYLPVGKYKNRFSLTFNKSIISSNPDTASVVTTELKIYSSGNNLFVNSNASKGTIVLMNMLGQVVFKQDISGIGNHEMKLQVSSGIYLATLVSDKGNQTKKIFIRN